MPPTPAGTAGVLPAIAGAAAAGTGAMQQLLGAVGGYSVGLVSHDDALNLGLLMLTFTGCSALAQGWLHRRPAARALHAARPARAAGPPAGRRR